MTNHRTITNIHTTITLLTQITDQLQTAITELQNNQPGYPTNTGTGNPPTLTPAGTPTGLDRYLNNKDIARTDWNRLHTAAQHTLTNAATIHQIVTTWANPAHPPTQHPNSQCLTCDHYTTNKGNDRLRSGLCQACHRSWTRARTTTDRGTWMLQRKQQTTGDMVTT
jgi:hypothetical protein